MVLRLSWSPLGEPGRCLADSFDDRGTGGNQAMRQGKGRIVLLGILWIGLRRGRSAAGPEPWPCRVIGACRTIDSASVPHLCSCSRARTFRSIYDSNGPRSWELKARSTSSLGEPLTLRGKTGDAVVAERRAIDEAQLEWLSNNLTGNQLERLRQIELQWEGVAAMLSRPMVASYLKLTPEQQQTLARIIAERNRLRAQGRSAPQVEQTYHQKALVGSLEQSAGALGQPPGNSVPVRRDDRVRRETRRCNPASRLLAGTAH